MAFINIISISDEKIISETAAGCKAVYYVKII